ncbi:defensin-5-like [Perognathus longimembris pacificus]|uniref:defensin-5-like n=1 Tax=Perognathus longimembris pacificus TaxID=214514 RepID=UPI0020184710|nr:defensin-5-like [Perognathus longimembris pacificus]
MRTWALLVVLCVLAVQAQGEPVPTAFEEATAQEDLEEDDQVPKISVFGDESSAFQDSGARAGRTCFCRLGACRSVERTLGVCYYRNRVYRFCC